MGIGHRQAERRKPDLGKQGNGEWGNEERERERERERENRINGSEAEKEYMKKKGKQSNSCLCSVCSNTFSDLFFSF